MDFPKFKDFLDRPPSSGAAGLQVLSVQVKIKTKFFFKELEVNLWNKICIFFFKYVNNIQKYAYFVS